MHEPTYAVYWEESGGPRYAGRMAFGPCFVELAGSGGNGSRSKQVIFFDEVAAARYERGRLHVSRHTGAALEIGNVDAPGALLEVAERLRIFLMTRPTESK
jgi:hypothetical protein